LSKIIGFIVLMLSSQAFADSVTLHLFRSPLGINWSTPWSMTFSALKNSLADTDGKRAFAISHVFVEVKCDSTGEHIFRGQTSTDDSNERELIFKEKYGMGVMFHTYKGKFEKDEAILKDMASYEGSERRGSFTALVQPSTCQRMLQYTREYEERGYGNIYSGLQADPLKGEGAGCSAFGMSFLRIAGLMEPFTSEWKNIVNVPKRFIGGPLTGKKVNILKILTHPAAQWSDKEAHIHLEAWNPEKMLSWVQKTHDLIQDGGVLNGYETSLESLGESKSVIVDLTHRPTPSGPFWLN
jgi:hypothetical protein